MAELHDALKYLSAVDWNDMPQDDLNQYMSDCFNAGELIANSVPHPPNGTPFSDAKPHHSLPNSAKSHKEMHPSAARAHPYHRDHESLQKNWGKPMKFKDADNPLKVAVFKMAGHDRHGAWFARKSVHEGLGFDRFKRAMMREFSESLTVTGGPGAGAIRGLAADRRLERIDVEGVGKLEVYQLSAQFPGPVTPRDFMTMVMSSDTVLSDKSAAEVDGGKKHVPRHYMIVSRPVEHPDAPLRSGFVRGHYESVELIREIPLSTAKSKSTPNLLSPTTDTIHESRARGDTVGSNKSPGVEHHDRPSSADGESTATHGSTDDPELNPVEWIMITRSDPGGGIPRFLVERGTPETMIADVHKFLDWACSLESIPHPDEDLKKQDDMSKKAGGTEEREASIAPTDGVAEESVARTKHQKAAQPISASQQPAAQGGILSNLTHAIDSGLHAYAPAAVTDMVHSHLYSPQHVEEMSSEDSSDTSSVASFLSANEMRRISTAEQESVRRPTDSVDALSIASGEVSEAASSSKNMSRHEKEIQKLVKKRTMLDEALTKKRQSEESKLKQMQEKEESEANKQKEEVEKKLKKTEEKHRKEVEKLEAKKAKESRKAEEKRKKKEEQNTLSRVARERDEFRSQADLLRRENTLLREQVADLQRQANTMAQKLPPGTLGTLADEIGHNRSKSVKSIGSNGSSDSVVKQAPKVS